MAAGSELILDKEYTKHSMVKAFLNTEAAILIFQYSHLFTGCLLRASWVNECKAFHLVYVCHCWVWKPGPLNVVSVGLLIEPDQFTEIVSRLAQLPHQRDSNNCTLWPLPSLKKPYLCLLQSKHGTIEHTENADLLYSFFPANNLDAKPFCSNLGKE